MKILVITFDLGTSSSGISTNRIVSELANMGNQVVVITGVSNNLQKNFDVIKCSPYPLKPARLYNFFGNIIQRDINYLFWQLRAYCKTKKLLKTFHPDVIYARSSPCCPFDVALRLSVNNDIPLVLHFADPIPATPDWHPKNIFRKKMVKTVLPSIIHASAISFVNETMQMYQEITTNLNLEKKSFILPNPIPSTKNFGVPSSTSLIFTFLGSFIGSRNPQTLFSAFSKVLHDYPLSELRIYGTSYDKISKYIDIHPQLKNKIKFFDRTSDVQKVLEESNFLIDIDSDVKYQVFSSNKLMEYLSVNRFIISITPDNSPSFNMLKNVSKTCFVSDHNIDNIYRTFIKAINTQWSYDIFSERNHLRVQFNISNISNILEKKLLSIVSKKDIPPRMI